MRFVIGSNGNYFDLWHQIHYTSVFLFVKSFVRHSIIRDVGYVLSSWKFSEEYTKYEPSCAKIVGYNMYELIE